MVVMWMAVEIHALDQSSQLAACGVCDNRSTRVPERTIPQLVGIAVGAIQTSARLNP